MWIVYALLAALFWGMSYTYSEQVLKKISVPSLLLFEASANVIMALCIGLAGKTFVTDWQTIKQGQLDAKVFFICLIVYAIANLFIMMSIQAKNATMAGLIEISYPIFTAFFAWLIFKETQFNAGTIFGGLLILSGVCCVYIYGKNI